MVAIPQNSSLCAWWNDNHSFFIITAIWHIKSPCQTWAGAFVIPLTPMNLKPFFTLLLSQTLFVHGEQATDFANNFQVHVSLSAFPAEMTSPIMHWLERFYFNHFALRYFKFTCTINQRKWPIIFSFKSQGVSFLIVMLCENFNMHAYLMHMLHGHACNFSSETFETFHWYQTT